MSEPPNVNDGIIDLEAYRAAAIEIVWLLKEFNDPPQTFTDLVVVLKKFATEQHRIDGPWKRTYRPVAQVTYGLLHPDKPWTDWADDELLYSEALSQIAVINVKKTSGGPKANCRELATHFESNKSQLEQQVFKEATPNLVIGGNVMWLCCHHWCGGWRLKPQFPKDKETPYESKLHGGIIWVHANHPSCPGKSRVYFERIRQAVSSAQAQE
jgi:hypothetical protein